MESSEQTVTGEHREEPTKEGALSEQEQAPVDPAEEPMQADPDPADAPATEGAGVPGDQPFDPSHSAAPTVPNEEGVPRQHGDINPDLGQSPSAFPGESAGEPSDGEE